MICSNPSSRASPGRSPVRPPAPPTPPSLPFYSPGEEKGWEYIKQYAGQISQYTKSGAAPAKFVGLGEGAVAIVFSHDIVNEIENNEAPLQLTFPAEGTGYEIGGMAIIKNAKHLQAAKLWFDWGLTVEAQSLGPKYKAYQAPPVKDAKASRPELMQAKLIKYDFLWAGSNKKAFVEKFTNEIANAENLKRKRPDRNFICCR